MRESNIREALDKRVKAYGGQTRAVTWLGRKGAPDVLCLFPSDSRFTSTSRSGVSVWVETKRPGKTPTEIQNSEHQVLRAAGCMVRVVTTLEELDKWLPPPR